MVNKYLYIKKSTIENAGDGAFAKCFIPKGTLICKYKGPILNLDEYLRLPTDFKDRCFQVEKEKFVYGNGIGSMINDIVDFREYSDEILIDILYNDFMPVLSGYEHNCCYFQKPKTYRIEIVALKDIHQDEELFAKYGESYWQRKFDETYYHYHDRIKNAEKVGELGSSELGEIENK